MADIMLAANQPMFVVWGPEHAMIYNDRCADILGGHHPSALGRPFFEAWPELVDTLGPIVARCYGGEPTYMDDIVLILHRKGYAEKAHFSLFTAPIHDKAGKVGGFLCACNEAIEQAQSKRERRDADTLNRQILDSAIDYAIVATDLDGMVTSWNEGARRIFGWSEAEMVGQTIGLIFTPADRSANRPQFEMRAAAETGVGSDERWHIRKTGEIFWASGEMTALKSEAGEIVGFVKVLRDRTEQRLAESRLLESEMRFRSLVEATPGFAWTATSDGKLTYNSPRWHAYSGSKPEQGHGDGWTGAVHPDDHERAIKTWAACIASGKLYEAEFRLQASDGSYRWWLARALPTRDQSGTIVMWAGVCTDIQAIVAAREALARSREDLEIQVAERTADRNRMWRLSTDLMLVAKLDSSITAVNPAWTTLLGWSETELVGRTFMEFLHPDDVFQTQRAARILATGPTILRFENRYRHRDGSYRWLAWTAVPDDIFINAVGRDVTDDKGKAEALARAEEALRQSQKMEAVGQLTGGIAHDFNNLLTGITGSLELLVKRLKQGRLEGIDRYVSTAQGAATRAAALTHRLLAFSRRQTLDPKPVNVNKLISEMEELLQRTVGPGIKVGTMLAGGLWATLCDSSQLDNAVLNLSINARDAMPDGGQLTIETANIWIDEQGAQERDMMPGQYVQISVTDTGTGMTPDVAARAFDPFFTTKPIGTGTGLGLSMIYGFAKQSGGQVRVHTQPNAGTAMRIYLPRYSGLARPEIAEAPPGRPAAGDHGETVLVVDDEATVRMLVTEVLEGLGFSAIEAADGPSGLKILQSDARIDLLISDVGMPGGMNGRQMADAARVGRPGLQVLFITGYAENAVVGNGQLEPGMHVITKPFSIDTLASRIKAIIGSSR